MMTAMNTFYKKRTGHIYQRLGKIEGGLSKQKDLQKLSENLDLMRRNCEGTLTSQARKKIRVMK